MIVEWLFWFCLRVGLWGRQAKANVPNVGGNKNFNFFARGEKIKIRRVGNECRLTCCPIEIWSLCWSPVKMVYFFIIYFSRFVVVVSFFTLAGNVPTLGAVGDFGKLNCQPAQIYNRSTNFH